MKLKVLFGLALYNLIGRHLPYSSSKINIGQRKFRAFCGRLILNECGKHVNIEKGAYFSPRCSLGDYSGIGKRAHVGLAKIGSHVMMGPDCLIIARNHKRSNTEVTMDLQGFDEEKQVIIEDDVWIGSRVIILPGVKIGQGAIIGAGTVVSKDVPPYSVFCGNPGKVVKKRLATK